MKPRDWGRVKLLFGDQCACTGCLDDSPPHTARIAEMLARPNIRAEACQRRSDWEPVRRSKRVRGAPIFGQLAMRESRSYKWHNHRSIS